MNKFEFYIWSDVHNEFKEMSFTPEDYNPSYPLVIAGDWGIASNKYLELLTEVLGYFDDVILVPGNHDYYGGSISDVDLEYRVLQKEFKKFGKNLHFLNPGVVNVKGLRIIGAALWTDINGANPVDIENTRGSLNDFRLIDEFKVKGINYWLSLNKEHSSFIINELTNSTEPTLVVTHFAPHESCVQEEFVGSSLNPLFHCTSKSGLYSLFQKEHLVGWVHGHMHTQDTIRVNGVPVFRNARGYHPHEKIASTWTPNTIFEVSYE